VEEETRGNKECLASADQLITAWLFEVHRQTTTKKRPVGLTAKQAPHRPGIAPALGLRAGDDVCILSQTALRKETTMWRNLSQRLLYQPRTSRQGRSQVERRRLVRLGLERLEDRLTPTNFKAATVADLIADNKAANKQGGTNTITLTAPATSLYDLTAVDNTTNGANGLPVITKNDTLTIIGNGDIIERGSGTPYFRIFDVAKGGSLILENLTLQNGLAFGTGSSAEGGAIYNQGTLDLRAVTVQNNIAQGQQGAAGYGSAATPGQFAAGGGIYSSGSLTLEGGTLVQNNQAIGGQGGLIVSFYGHPGWRPGGNGFGGGLYIANGKATLTDTTVISNIARMGGGGGPANAGLGEGGGLYIDPGATVFLDAFTVANILNNIAWTSNNDTLGSYNPIP
jgi:hypothetical protein